MFGSNREIKSTLLKTIYLYILAIYALGFKDRFFPDFMKPEFLAVLAPKKLSWFTYSFISDVSCFPVVLFISTVSALLKPLSGSFFQGSEYFFWQYPMQEMVLGIRW